MKIKARVIQINEYEHQLEVTDDYGTSIYQDEDDVLAFYDEMPYEMNAELCRTGEVEYDE